MNCEKCKKQRWLLHQARWQDDVLVSELWPFSRDSWSAYGSLAISAALASKALIPCPECNQGKRPAWSKSWANAQQLPSSDEPTPF